MAKVIPSGPNFCPPIAYYLFERRTQRANTICHCTRPTGAKRFHISRAFPPNPNTAITRPPAREIHPRLLYWSRCTLAPGLSLPIASYSPYRYQQRPCESDCLHFGRGALQFLSAGQAVRFYRANKKNRPCRGRPDDLAYYKYQKIRVLRRKLLIDSKIW